MPSKPIVLITGGTGFVGSHIVQQLLEQDQYIVRGAVRQARKLLSIFPDAGAKLEVVEIPSLTADYSQALKDVQALIHVAAPIYNNGDSGRELFSGVYHGSLNVVEAAIDAGVRKIIVTGTFVNAFGPDFKAAFGSAPLTAESFGPVQSEADIDVEKDDLISIYQQAKTLAEKRIWQLAREHPDVDITVLLPPVVLGPFLPNYHTIVTRQSLGSMDFPYQLLVGGPAGPNTYPDASLGHLVDVRDVAKTHILSLATPPTADGTNKRFFTVGKIFTWQETAELLKRERPGIAHRLPGEHATPIQQTNVPIDQSLTENVLGFRKEDYVPWEKTILDSIDALLQWEEFSAHTTKSG